VAYRPAFLQIAGPRADKMTRAQAEYQDTPNGIYSCGTCTLFVAPNPLQGGRG